MFTREIHSSLLQSFVNYGHKSFLLLTVARRLVKEEPNPGRETALLNPGTNVQNLLQL
jgi:hypothetical protein